MRDSAPFPRRATSASTVRIMSARPHHLGSPYGKQNAEWMLAKIHGMGLGRSDRKLRRAFPDAERAARRDGGTHRFGCRSRSRRSPVDPTSSQKAEQLPPFNAYSVDGDVTGPLVYVNYGRPVDYEELDRRGISVKGAIVIARYGGVVARHQAEGRGRARRDRLSDLFRSA